jgi:leucyl-tRNA synthetase
VYALQHNIHPRQAVKENVKNFRSQLEMMGFSYD